jgi:hypothetical protein
MADDQATNVLETAAKLPRSTSRSPSYGRRLERRARERRELEEAAVDLVERLRAAHTDLRPDQFARARIESLEAEKLRIRVSRRADLRRASDRWQQRADEAARAGAQQDADCLRSRASALWPWQGRGNGRDQRARELG